MINKKGNKWLFALGLTIPMIAFFGGYLLNYNRDYIPTGLIMEDNGLYLSYARQYLDADKLHLFYNNPFNDSGNYTPIYFQTQSVLLALMMQTGISAGYLMIIFVLLFSLLCFRVIIEIYDALVPEGKYRTLGIILFAWGGGLLALAGIPVHFMRPPDGQDLFDRMFFLDPGWGWWGLNPGRSFFITCEAFYHLFFLLSILLLLKKKWKTALLCIFILSISHPFTGIELLSILGAWLFVEKIIIRNKNIPWYFAIGTGLIMAFHVYYYLYYLNQFTDHRSVSEQFSVNWRLRFFSMIPAYAIVAPLAFLGIFKFSKPKLFFQHSHNRLFLCWLIVVMLLVNHELFMKPRQPIHFTRGYDWTGFFLLGLPALAPVFDYLRKIKRGRVLLAVFVCLFLSDNFLWITNYIRFTDKTKSVMYISPEQKEILNLVTKKSDNTTLVISSDFDLSLLTAVYSKAYPWISNPYTTPFYQQKKEAFDQFILTGKTDSAWLGRKIIFIFNKKDSLEAAAAARNHSAALLETRTYKLFSTDSLATL
ncbi:MAG: hypothetical protein ABI688_05755 [Bacteroidota bacterium]